MEILLDNPKAALELFLDHNVEPPLCYAVRIGCKACLVRLLLQHGAELQDQNARGQTPLSLLVRQPRDPEELEWTLPRFLPAPRQRRRLEVAATLAEFGADPASPDGTGRSPADQARAAGDEQLLLFWAGALRPESLPEDPGLLPEVAVAQCHATFLCGPGARELEQTLETAEFMTTAAGADPLGTISP